MFAYAKPKQKQAKDIVQKKDSKMINSAPNRTGIPDAMKTHFETLSGSSFDDVRVHYNSDKPAQLQALAYTQGNQVHIGPGQEQHLGHELGHVVQQKAGKVKPTGHLRGFPVNNDTLMEREADDIANGQSIDVQCNHEIHNYAKPSIQRKILNTHTGKPITSLGQFSTIFNLTVKEFKDKYNGQLVETCIESDNLYTVEDMTLKLNMSGRQPFKLGAPSTDVNGEDQYYKITELGYPRYPTKIKAHEQPGGVAEITKPDEIQQATVTKNPTLTDLSKGRVELKEYDETGKTDADKGVYLWVQKHEKGAERIKVATEVGGLGHPTLAVDLSSADAESGTAGKARIGGELKKIKDTIFIDDASGRYGKGRSPRNLQPPKELIEKAYPGFKVVATQKKRD